MTQALPDRVNMEHCRNVRRGDEGTAPAPILEKEVLIHPRPRDGNQPPIGLLLGSPDQNFNLLGMLPVVTVKNRQELPGRHRETDVSGRVSTGVFRTKHNLDAVIRFGPLVEPLLGIAAGTVVKSSGRNIGMIIVTTGPPVTGSGVSAASLRKADSEPSLSDNRASPAFS
jgi:hypothetical protein